MTLKRYLFDGSTSGTALVTEIIEGERPRVRLRETWFHPQGGGQKGDRGLLGPSRVLDTRHTDVGEVDHHVDSLAGLAVGDTVRFAIDVEHRRCGARLHSGGHLLADAVQVLRPSLRAVAGHHWAGEARVEFEGALDVGLGFRSEVEAKLRELVDAQLLFAIEGDPLASRAIRIGDFDPVPCGGTHVSTTVELATLTLTGIKVKGGRLRVSYIC